MNTDVIIPGRYLVSIDPKELATHAFEPLGEEAQHWLERYLMQARPQLAGKRLLPHLFLNASGEAPSRQQFWAAIKRYAAVAGIDTILFNGRDADIARLLSHGKVRGTRLRSTHTKLQARKYWLRHTPAVPGCIRIDPGAVRALCDEGASLLPTGVLGAEGEFQRGDMVEIVNAQDSLCIARGITQYGAAEINLIHGCHTSEIEQCLGYSYGDSVVNRDDLATVAEGQDHTNEGASSDD